MIRSMATLIAYGVLLGLSLPQTGAPHSSTKKLALLVGINNYKYPDKVSSLEGCLNDVRDIRDILISKRYGFRAEDIHVLRNEEATRENILKEFNTHLIAKANPGDVVVFYYSGH